MNKDSQTTNHTNKGMTRKNRKKKMQLHKLLFRILVGAGIVLIIALIVLIILVILIRGGNL